MQFQFQTQVKKWELTNMTRSTRWVQRQPERLVRIEFDSKKFKMTYFLKKYWDDNILNQPGSTQVNLLNP